MCPPPSATRHWLPVALENSVATVHEPVNPKKLLLSKWAAVKFAAKQKHFWISRVIEPELPTDPIELVETEAFFSKATHVIAWRSRTRLATREMARAARL